jgi:hypothetical protein
MVAATERELLGAGAKFGATTNWDEPRGGLAIAARPFSERRITGFKITNRLPRAAMYLTAVDQDSPLCCIYLGNAWLLLSPVRFPLKKQDSARIFDWTSSPRRACMRNRWDR